MINNNIKYMNKLDKANNNNNKNMLKLSETNIIYYF